MNPLAASDPEETVTRWRADVERTLEDIAGELPADDPVSAALRYALGTGGKRLRPVLMLAAMDAVGAAVPSVASLRAACALELIHTYSLVHDDLPCMDDDAMRRGRPTTHRVFGAPAAALAGFSMIPLAASILRHAAVALGCDGARQAGVVRELCTGAGAAGMVGGQVLDLGAENRMVSHAGLVTIHGMKTGALFRASLRIGGVLGAGSSAAVNALGEFGTRLGLAFQITDDVLDVTGESVVLGKTAGKDLDADKSTFVSHVGVDEARRAAAAEVDAAVAGLAAAGLRSPLLEGLARFAVSRDR